MSQQPSKMLKQDEIKNEIDDFLKIASEFNKIYAAATRQKK